MKIVLDTNVLISAFINPYGKPARVLKLILTGKVDIILDERIIGEYTEVARRPKFGLPADEVNIILDFLRKHGIIPLPYDHTPIFLPDSDDIPFIEVAVSGNADAIVTGNKKHFPRKSTHNIKISSADEFLESFYHNHLVNQ